jgi:hypothetical protein
MSNIENLKKWFSIELHQGYQVVYNAIGMIASMIITTISKYILGMNDAYVIVLNSSNNTKIFPMEVQETRDVENRNFGPA